MVTKEIEMGSEFKLAYLRFHFVVNTEIVLPVFMGSIFRGSLGKIFRNITCIQRQESCQTCIFMAKCPYSLLFESPSLGKNLLSWHTKYEPHPFILEPPYEEKIRYDSGERFQIGLVLVGEGVSYLPYFIMAFDKMGKVGIGKERGNFSLDFVEAENMSTSEVIYTANNGNLMTNFYLITLHDINTELYDLDPTIITVNFLTPARLQNKNRLTSKINFEIFIRAIMRRYSWMSSLYCSSLPALPFSDLVCVSREQVEVGESNLIWYDMERYSFRQKRNLKMGGVKGTITFKGNLKPFLHLIKLAEYLHIGKGTAFGLGKYKFII